MQNTRELRHPHEYRLQKTDAICVNCGSKEGLIIHHIVPLVLGGTDAPTNRVVLCGGCHHILHMASKGGSISHSVLTKEGIRRAKAAGKQIGLRPGTKLNIKKAAPAKEIIRKHSRSFEGSLTDAECIKLTGLARNTYYKYKKEVALQYRL